MKSSTARACLDALPMRLHPHPRPGFVQLFNGKDFTGWKISNPASFTIENGAIVANGTPGHAYYDGPVGKTFRNFELKVDVMTKPNSNGGIYVMTEFQEKGWPSKGFEIQVNNTYKDPVKSGSLYHVSDIFEAAGERRRVVHRAHHRARVTRSPSGSTTSRRCSGRSRPTGTAAARVRGDGSVPARSRCRHTIRAAPSTTRTFASSRWTPRSRRVRRRRRRPRRQPVRDAATSRRNPCRSSSPASVSARVRTSAGWRVPTRTVRRWPRPPGRATGTWRAYLSTQGANAVNARDRIGKGPWYNVKRRVGRPRSRTPARRHARSRADGEHADACDRAQRKG